MHKRLSLLTIFLITSTLIFAASPVFAQSSVTNTVSLSTGEDFSLAVKADGSVVGWGSNKESQIESGKSGTYLPTKIKGLSDIVSVYAGFNTAMALAQNGDVYVWGGNAVLTRITSINGAVKIQAGIGSFYALTNDGSVYSWAADKQPVKMSLPPVTDIASGDNHCLFLTVTGKVYAMGENFLGQLGNGNTRGSNSPILVAGLPDIVNIGAGSNHSFAVTRSGKVYAWGHNADRQLGVGVNSDQVLTPKLISSLSNIKQIDGGSAHSVALTNEGKIYTWGNGASGQLGLNSDVNKDIPQLVAVNIKADAVSAGGGNTFVKGGGLVKGFGKNDTGQVGITGTSNILRAMDITNDIRTETKFSFDAFPGISSWARADAQTMYDNAVIPLGMIHNLRENITRAEFSALVVSAYEFAKNKEAPDTVDVNFVDIQNHPFEADIKKANSLNIIDGVSETEFKPDDVLTREQAAKMLANAYGAINTVNIPIYNYSKLVFADSKSVSTWAEPYISFVIDRRIMQGISDTEFLPKGNLTREAAIVTVRRIVLR